MNNAKNGAIVLIKASMRYAERRNCVLPEAFKKTFCEDPQFIEIIASLIIEAEKISDDNLNKWKQLMSNMSMQMKEIETLYETAEVTSPKINKNRAINSQVAITLYSLFCGLSAQINMIQDFSGEQFEEQYCPVMMEGLKLVINQPSWKMGMLLPLKFPSIIHAMQEGVAKISMNSIPAAYRGEIENIMKAEGLSVAVQTMSQKAPNWLKAGEMNEKSCKKTMLALLLLSNLGEHEDLLVLCDQHLSIVSEAFSEEALGLFLAKLEPLVNMQDIMQYPMLKHAQHPILQNTIQKHNDNFFYSIKRQIEENQENISVENHTHSTFRP